MTDYVYDVGADTASARVNAGILVQQLLDAGLASGGVLEKLEVLGGTNDLQRPGVVTAASVPGSITITWQNPLSGADTAAQDGLVAAHTGDGYQTEPQATESLGVSSTGTNMVKLQLTSASPLAEGVYELSASAEVRLQGVVGGTLARGSVEADGVELIQHNNGTESFQVFGITALLSFESGDIPNFQILLEVVGANTAEIQQARLSLTRAG